MKACAGGLSSFSISFPPSLPPVYLMLSSIVKIGFPLSGNTDTPEVCFANFVGMSRVNINLTLTFLFFVLPAIFLLISCLFSLLFVSIPF